MVSGIAKKAKFLEVANFSLKIQFWMTICGLIMSTKVVKIVFKAYATIKLNFMNTFRRKLSAREKEISANNKTITV